MTSLQRALLALLFGVAATAPVRGEILIRWDQDQIPAPMSLGISTVVVPATNSVAVRAAIAQGYRVFVELEGPSLTAATPLPKGVAGAVVKGKSTPPQLLNLRQRLQAPGARVLALDTQGKWPHIRSNWVTKNKEVLQVTSRSAQPWIENNAALVRIARGLHPDDVPLMTYAWTPITLSDVDEGPALHNYLVAIAEAGSYGADLILPLHDRFQKRLLLGQPEARADWNEIRRYVEFYSWSLAARYRPIANIGIVADEPMQWFEVMNLLLRHNLPFELVAPSQLGTRDLTPFDVIIAFDSLTGKPADAIARFAKNGGRVLQNMKPVTDPNAFALEVRQLLGREHRVIDIWNGITVLAAPYAEPDEKTVLLTVVNYAEQPVPVQLQIQGAFSLVQYESPEEPASLLPYQHRDGFTQFVIPRLRIGGRVFLSPERK